MCGNELKNTMVHQLPELLYLTISPVTILSSSVFCFISVFILTRLGLVTVTSTSGAIDSKSYFPTLELRIILGIAELDSDSALLQTASILCAN